MELRLSRGQVGDDLCLLDSLLLASLARSGAQSFAATNAPWSLVVDSLLVAASLHKAASLVSPLPDPARPLVDVEILWIID